MLNENKRAFAAMAMIFLAGVSASAAIVRFWSQTPATLLGEAFFLALTITGVGAVLQTNCHSRGALLSSAAILAMGIVLPAVLVPNTPRLGRELLQLMMYCCLFLYMVSIPPRRGPAWCKSVTALMIASAVMACAVTLSFLLF
jgi:hypothetical protein